jgi:hypothetical protein
MLSLLFLAELTHSQPNGDEQTIPSDTPTLSAAAAPTVITPHSPSSSNAGSVAGIVFAALVFVGLVIGGVVWYVKNRDTQYQEIRSHDGVANV